MELRWIAVGVFLVLGAIRIFEMILDRVHVRRLVARGATWHGRAGLEIIVFGQVILFAGILAEGYLFPPHPQADAGTFAALGVAVLALALRHWCIFALGDRWTLTVYTLDEPLVHRGPYRFLRHPNYVAVLVELVAIAVAVQAWATLVAAGSVTLVGLSYRIQRENAALGPLRTITGPRQTS